VVRTLSSSLPPRPGTVLCLTSCEYLPYVPLETAEHGRSRISGPPLRPWRKATARRIWKLHIFLRDGDVGIILNSAESHQALDAAEVRGTRHHFLLYFFRCRLGQSTVYSRWKQSADWRSLKFSETVCLCSHEKWKLRYLVPALGDLLVGRRCAVARASLWALLAS